MKIINRSRFKYYLDVVGQPISAASKEVLALDSELFFAFAMAAAIIKAENNNALGTRAYLDSRNWDELIDKNAIEESLKNKKDIFMKSLFRLHLTTVFIKKDNKGHFEQADEILNEFIDICDEFGINLNRDWFSLSKKAQLEASIIK